MKVNLLIIFKAFSVVFCALKKKIMLGECLKPKFILNKIFRYNISYDYHNLIKLEFVVEAVFKLYLSFKSVQSF